MRVCWSAGTPVRLLVAGERVVEPAHLAGRLVGVDDALLGGLVVCPLRLVPELAGPLLVTGLNRPVEALGEVLEAGVDGAVLLEALEALLVSFGRCGHVACSSYFDTSLTGRM